MKNEFWIYSVMIIWNDYVTKNDTRLIVNEMIYLAEEVGIVAK